MKQALLWIVSTLLLGLALPVTAGEPCHYSAQECLELLVSDLRERGWVGLELDEDQATGTTRIARVVAGSPAESAGFKAGDELVVVNGIEINERNHDALHEARRHMRPGQRVTYTVAREGRNREISLTLAELPPEVLAQWVGSHMLDHSTVEITRK